MSSSIGSFRHFPQAHSARCGSGTPHRHERLAVERAQLARRVYLLRNTKLAETRRLKRSKARPVEPEAVGSFRASHISRPEGAFMRRLLGDRSPRVFCASRTEGAHAYEI